MIKSKQTLEKVKDAIGKLKEQRVQVTVSLGRNKYQTYLGQLKGVYPALFTVAPIEKDFKGKTSYSYSEFMCGKVKIKRLSKAE